MEKKMSTVLFITAPIRSHILPSFFLAELLKADHRVYYAALEGEFADLVVQNGYETALMNSERFALGYDPLAAYNKHKGKLSWSFFKDAIGNSIKKKVYYKRMNNLQTIVDTINPTLILIDVFSSTDFLILKPLYPHISFSFFNPMLNTHDNLQYPTVTQGSYDKRKVTTTLFSKIKWFTSPTRLMAKLTGYDPIWQIKWVYRKYPLLKKYPPAKNNHTIRIFDNIPEIILAPLELEFNEQVKLPSQLYVGLSMPMHRIDTQLDEGFAKRFEEILTLKKQQHTQLVYCSFGSYFFSLDEHKSIIAFCMFLMKAFYNTDNCTFIVSVKKEISEAVFKYLPAAKNFHFFTRVKQTQVLEQADVFVTHGGLGSLKEAIAHKVPMLVYPLDQTWDQPGNSLKIEHHGLGIRGNFKDDGQMEIKEKLTKLLAENAFRQRIAAFNGVISSKYNNTQLLKDIMDMIKKYND